ncbi:hypothetical protein M1L60_31495 [Actinoplanes sp. TRM 88003]|uniref:Uncharacterized protein n=1 Tax=Paractinoplanes aksuensis TaxID=2939490 RepID=A0ABT1DW86_9ACTN|nr:hypothetical protein [Actinoplanes aksuensis]MCO8275114.1 hypothetical protein [Actinoplanes aksuensis]
MVRRPGARPTAARDSYRRLHSNRQRGDAEDGRLSERFKAVLGVVSPLAVGTVLLFYFGWVRTKTEAAALGFDSKILEFTTADYVLRSVNVLSLPLVAVLVLTFGALRGHRWLTERVGPAGRRRVAYAMLHFWLLCLVIAVFLAQFAPSAATPAAPFLLTAATGSALYGEHLRAALEPALRWSLAVRVVMVSLLVIAVIGDTERLARAVGEGLADSVVTDPGQLAAVEIHSTKDLAIVVPNVSARSDPATAGAFRFHYSGLRLLQRSGDKYLLINDGWSPETGRVLLLRDSADIRLEFHH